MQIVCSAEIVACKTAAILFMPSFSSSLCFGFTKWGGQAQVLVTITTILYDPSELS